jgi:hypothetical protein
LRQAVRVGNILVDEEAAPTSFDGIEILTVKGNARADDLHVVSAVVAQRLAGAEWDAVLALQHDLVL